jgi:TPR repeat protein
LGNEWSQLYVGELYAKGEIVPKDLRKARGFFEAAAKQGSKEATQNLEVLDHWEATSKRQ